MPYFFILFLTSLLFFTFKAANAALRQSDTNIYFYTAYALSQGKLLYKDIFFTNLPLFPYISLLYNHLLNWQLESYYLTSVFEVIVVASIIFLIIKKEHNHLWLALLGSLLYLFSFIVLSTTDHQTGVFLGSVFAIAAYLAYRYKKVFISGVLLGMALCVKAYFLPIILGFGIYLLLRNRKEFLLLSLGCCISVLLIVGPSLVYAREEFIQNIVGYSLTRAQGLAKLPILKFFIIHDIALFTLFIFSLWNIKRNLLLGLISLASLVFVLLYQDIYYLYLNFLIPFLVLNLGELYKSIHKFQLSYKWGLLGIIAFLQIWNIYLYITQYSHTQKIAGKEIIISLIKKEDPDYLYGENTITPALAYLTNTPLLDSVIDTNTNIFRKGYLNAEKMTTKALSSRTIIITEGVEYPAEGISETIVSEVMDADRVKAGCQQIHSQPLRTEGQINRLNIYRCY